MDAFLVTALKIEDRGWKIVTLSILDPRSSILSEPRCVSTRVLTHLGS